MHYASYARVLHNNINTPFPAVNQEVLIQRLHSIFPATSITINARKPVNVKLPATGSALEVDAWLPDLNIGFEFQDFYHYVPTWYSHSTQAEIQGKDNIFNRGISMMTIPCWWSGTVESLVATIRFQRPDILLRAATSDDPISTNPPLHYFQNKTIPDVGELMLASFPEEKFIVTPSTWWMGEKYDGIRSCWHSQLRIGYPDPVLIPHFTYSSLSKFKLIITIYTRSGRALPLLPELDGCLPRIIADGEFWFGRGLYANAYMLVNGAIENVQWHMMKFIVFDAPSVCHQQKPFEKRYKHLLAMTPSNDPFVIVAPRVLCEDTTQVDLFIQHIIDDGGEGVILRKLRSRYEYGRTSTLFKLKSSFGDKEAIVVGLSSDTAELAMPNGLTFAVPLREDVELAFGDVVTFSYDTYSRREAPVNPKIQRVRTDMSWEDVVNSTGNDHKSDDIQPSTFTTQPTGHWTESNMREFLQNLAIERNLDPLLAETWYNVQSKDIRTLKSGATLLTKFRGYTKAVQTLFPDVKLESNSFSRGSWTDVDKRRIFFEQYAKDNGFNHANPESWYAQPPELIMSAKGAAGVVKYHKNLAQALVDLFPEIGLEKQRFGEQYLWNSPSKRRRFFENFAKANGFDPYTPESWYALQKEKILVVKGVYNVIYYHKNSIAQALLDLFPDVGLSQAKLLPQLPRLPKLPSQARQRREFWTAEDKRNRRGFFDSYARQHQFDPLIAANWYSTSRSSVLNEGGMKLLASFKGSLITALVQTYPETKFDESKFTFTKRNYWADKNTRREFMINFAKKRNFDPLVPENWYSIPQKVISENEKKMASILSFYNNSYAEALTDLLPEIAIDPAKFVKTKKGYWLTPNNRRRFFDNFAAKKKMDPLLPSSWYSIQKRHIMGEKGWKPVLDFYGGSVHQALLNLYPDIGLYPSKFLALKISFFESSLTVIIEQLGNDPSPKDPLHQYPSDDRLFFDRFAAKNRIDPLVPTNWYRTTPTRIFQEKGGREVMQRYNGSLARALVELYPDINLDPYQFYTSKVQQSQWTKKEKVKLFFDTMAQKHGFDPARSMDQWYALKRIDFASEPGGSTIMNHFKGSLNAALASVYPNLKARRITAHPVSHRRLFFNAIASAKGFDPLVAANWLTVNAKEVLAIKGGAAILAEFGGSIPLATAKTYN